MIAPSIEKDVARLVPHVGAERLPHRENPPGDVPIAGGPKLTNGRELNLLWVSHFRNPQTAMGLVRVSVSFLVAILGAYPAWTFYRGPYRRTVRRKKGLCLTCSYDLTGNESGVCPECGTKAGEK